jgi:hypothetical protein
MTKTNTDTDIEQIVEREDRHKEVSDDHPENAISAYGTARSRVKGAPLSSDELRLQFGHFQRFITARIVDILGRSGLNHGGVANDVRRGALAEGLGLNLFAQECY